MRNVLLLAAAFLMAAAGVALATGNEYEVGGAPVRGNTVPFWAAQPAMRFQCLWFKEEINEQGNVARIEYKFESYGGTPPAKFEGCKMILCHSNKTTLTNNFKDNYDFKTPFEVYSGDFTVPGGLSKEDWFTVVEPDNFVFNNNNNLLMEITWTKGSGADRCLFWISTANQPGRVRAYNATAVTGTLLPDQGQVARITIGNPAVNPTSLGRVKALLR
jgi:hypothetical protein